MTESAQSQMEISCNIWRGMIHDAGLAWHRIRSGAGADALDGMGGGRAGIHGKGPNLAMPRTRQNERGAHTAHGTGSRSNGAGWPQGDGIGRCRRGRKQQGT